jgi:adenylylsulfate kinase
MGSNIVWHEHTIQKADRIGMYAQKPYIIWLTGLSGSGKSTIANALESELFKNGYKTYLLDGDNIRHGLNRDLGFDDAARVENIRRIGEVAKLLVDAGLIVICSFISPFENERKLVRSLVEDGEFVEVFVDTPLGVCEQRDPKGLYKKARNGEIRQFTGIDSDYEIPSNPELRIDASALSIELAVDRIVDFLNGKKC